MHPGFGILFRAQKGAWCVAQDTHLSLFLLVICNLFYQIWNSHLRAGKVPSYEYGLSTNHQEIIYENQSCSVTAAFQGRNVHSSCLFLMGCLTGPRLISEIRYLCRYVKGVSTTLLNSNQYSAMVEISSCSGVFHREQCWAPCKTGRKCATCHS